jgi:hypothetical protein
VSSVKNMMGLQDARSTRGILSRGAARYGISRAPKPGNLFNIQRAAKNRMKKRQKEMDKRNFR